MIGIEEISLEANAACYSLSLILRRKQPAFAVQYYSVALARLLGGNITKLPAGQGPWHARRSTPKCSSTLPTTNNACRHTKTCRLLPLICDIAHPLRRRIDKQLMWVMCAAHMCGWLNRFQATESCGKGTIGSDQHARWGSLARWG